MDQGLNRCASNRGITPGCIGKAPEYINAGLFNVIKGKIADFAADIEPRDRRALRRLIGMKWTYPRGPFIAAIEQALQYDMFDLGRLEARILKQVVGDFFALDAGDDGDA